MRQYFKVVTITLIRAFGEYKIKKSYAIQKVDLSCSTSGECCDRPFLGAPTYVTVYCDNWIRENIISEVEVSMLWCLHFVPQMLQHCPQAIHLFNNPYCILGYFNMRPPIEILRLCKFCPCLKGVETTSDRVQSSVFSENPAEQYQKIVDCHHRYPATSNDA